MFSLPLNSQKGSLQYLMCYSITAAGLHWPLLPQDSCLLYGAAPIKGGVARLTIPRAFTHFLPVAASSKPLTARRCTVSLASTTPLRRVVLCATASVVRANAVLILTAKAGAALASATDL